MRLVYSLTLIALVALFAACTTTGGTGSVKPAVQILVPAFGATFVEGQDVGIQSIATDPAGISRVELSIDGQLVKADLAPTQGQTQFNVVQVWVAQGVGAHTVLVRAFNTANGSGEASIPIAVNAANTVQPTNTVEIELTVSPPTVEQATATLPPATAEPPAQTDVPVIPTATPIPPTLPPPTAIPPTPIPPTPIPPTAVPIVFLPPFDGGMDVFLSWNGEQMQIGAFANDTLVGGNNGDGIAHIDFFIQDLNGNVIATKRENNKPYCFFGEADGECAPSKLGDANFQWGPGKPIQDGWYFIRAIGYTPDNRIQVAERPLYVNLGGATGTNLSVNITDPFDFNISKEFTIKAVPDGPSAASGIDHVDFFVVTFDGRIVHKHTEQSADYCGFSGGEANPCNIYNFKQNGFKWPNGEPVNPTQYIVRAIAYARNGAVAANTVFFQIDSLE